MTQPAHAPVATPGPVTPANANWLPLPPSGNVQAQLQQGQALVAKMANLANTGNVTDLLGAGITIAQGYLTTQTPAVVRTMVTIGTAVASGAAVGGPFGAVAGAAPNIGDVRNAVAAALKRADADRAEAFGHAITKLTAVVPQPAHGFDPGTWGASDAEGASKQLLARAAALRSHA